MFPFMPRIRPAILRISLVLTSGIESVVNCCGRMSVGIGHDCMKVTGPQWSRKAFAFFLVGVVAVETEGDWVVEVEDPSVGTGARLVTRDFRVRGECRPMIASCSASPFKEKVLIWRATSLCLSVIVLYRGKKELTRQGLSRDEARDHLIYDLPNWSMDVRISNHSWS